MEMASAAMSIQTTVADRVRGALYGLLIGDALAMPTHWFYGGSRQVSATYGKRLEGYVAPVSRLPGSIMSKSNTGGAGRGGFGGNIIGSVIFHGKKKFWAPGKDYHYHQGMDAGDNTLEALLVRRAAAVSAASGGRFDPAAIMQDYVAFMTTPGMHNDTYCGTSHRMFFGNREGGKPLAECPDNDQHNVDTIDALVTTVPISLLAASDTEAAKNTSEMVLLTRASPASSAHAAVFSKLLRDVVRGGNVGVAVATAATTLDYRLSQGGYSRHEDSVTA